MSSQNNFQKKFNRFVTTSEKVPACMKMVTFSIFFGPRDIVIELFKNALIRFNPMEEDAFVPNLV